MRYDNIIPRVLVDREECLPPPPPSKRDRRASSGRLGIAELNAYVMALKAEHERVTERLTQDLDRLADRLAELERRTQWSFWRRAFGSVDDRPELAERARRTLTERLRGVFLDRADAKRRSGV